MAKRKIWRGKERKKEKKNQWYNGMSNLYDTGLK